MKCIKEYQKFSTIINKSEFICHLSYVQNEEEAKNFIGKISKKYSDASHNCYCYVIDDVVRVSDDGEPSKTAGVPMLEVLKHHNLNYIVCVVTRYFGGVKLGAGGLIRAYSKSVSNAIKETPLSELVDGYNTILTMEFNDIKKINNILNKHQVEPTSIKYDLKVKYNITFEADKYLKISDEIKQYNHEIEIKKISDVKIIKDSK